MHHPVDVQALGCDFYVFSAHKLYGPTGIGALYARSELLQTMAPWEGGGSMIATVSLTEGTTGIRRRGALRPARRIPGDHWPRRGADLRQPAGTDADCRV